MLQDDMTKWRDNLVVTGLSKSCPLLFFEDALDAYRNVSSRGNMPFTCKHGKMEMIPINWNRCKWVDFSYIKQSWHDNMKNTSVTSCDFRRQTTCSTIAGTYSQLLSNVTTIKKNNWSGQYYATGRFSSRNHLGKANIYLTLSHRLFSSVFPLFWDHYFENGGMFSSNKLRLRSKQVDSYFSWKRIFL